MADSCELDNVISGSIKDGEYLDLWSYCKLLKKDSAPWMYLIGSLVRQLVNLSVRILYDLNRSLFI
jgi:wobble nucleotide-excising tRNase